MFGLLTNSYDCTKEAYECKIAHFAMIVVDKKTNESFIYYVVWKYWTYSCGSKGLSNPHHNKCTTSCSHGNLYFLQHLTNCL